MENIQTKAFAGAFLRYENEVLLMHRSIHKKIAPGLWAGIGGGILESEMSSPITACLREIEEETGITEAQIEALNLRYFVLLDRVDNRGTLDSVYYFAGVLKEKPPLIETPEGKLHWGKLKDGVNLPMSTFMKAIYLHWIENLHDTNIHCYVGNGIKPINYKEDNYYESSLNRRRGIGTRSL